MTNPNPFGNAATAPAQPQPAQQDPWAGQAPAQPQYQAPAQPQFQAPAAPPQNNGQQFADAPSTAPTPAPGGDPFSDPTGNSGEKLADMLGRLLLCRPLEIIPSMMTTSGQAENVVRCNIAILDDPVQQGRVVEGVLVFQLGPKRDLGDIFRNPSQHMLIGRLALGEAKGNKSAPYFFVKATDQEKALAKQFLAVVPF